MIHPRQGPLVVLKNNGLDVFSIYSNSEHNLQNITNLKAITNALIYGLQSYQGIVNDLRYISGLHSLEMRISDNETWYGLTINDRLERLRGVARFTNEYLAENNGQVDEDVNLSIGITNSIFQEIQNLYQRLYDSVMLYNPTHMHYNDAMAQWYGNYNFADGALLHNFCKLCKIINRLDETNEPNIQESIIRPFTTTFVSQQKNICLKYAYNIAKFFETYNVGLMPISGDVVTDVPKFYCREILEQLPEYESFSRPRKTSSIITVHDAIKKKKSHSY